MHKKCLNILTTLNKKAAKYYKTADRTTIALSIPLGLLLALVSFKLIATDFTPLGAAILTFGIPLSVAFFVAIVEKYKLSNYIFSHQKKLHKEIDNDYNSLMAELKIFKDKPKNSAHTYLQVLSLTNENVLSEHLALMGLQKVRNLDLPNKNILKHLPHIQYIRQELLPELRRINIASGTSTKSLNATHSELQEILLDENLDFNHILEQISEGDIRKTMLAMQFNSAFVDLLKRIITSGKVSFMATLKNKSMTRDEAQIYLTLIKPAVQDYEKTLMYLADSTNRVNFLDAPSASQQQVPLYGSLDVFLAAHCQDVAQKIKILQSIDLTDKAAFNHIVSVRLPEIKKMVEDAETLKMRVSVEAHLDQIDSELGTMLEDARQKLSKNLNIINKSYLTHAQ